MDFFVFLLFLAAGVTLAPVNPYETIAIILYFVILVYCNIGITDTVENVFTFIAYKIPVAFFLCSICAPTFRQVCMKDLLSLILR